MLLKIVNYYFDDMIRFWNKDIEFGAILLQENSYKEK